MSEDELSAEQKNHIKGKVDEYLPEFLHRLPGELIMYEYALSYVVQKLSQELINAASDETGKQTSLQAFTEWAEHMSKPEPPKGERQQLMDYMRRRHRKNRTL